MISQAGYYAEINCIAVIILFFLYRQIRLRETGERPATRILRFIIGFAIVLCVSDFLAALFRGRKFISARAILEIANIAYIATGLIITCLALVYVILITSDTEVRSIVWTMIYLPMGLVVLSMLLNPLTSFYFTLDENNTYSRGPGVALTWVLMIMYAMCSIIYAHYRLKKTKNQVRQDQCRSLIRAFIPAFAAGVIQGVFYGVTVNQIGIVLSIFVIFMDTDVLMALKDELTGLNNRRALKRYAGTLVERTDRAGIYVFLLDVDDYKLIGSTYGEIEQEDLIRNLSGILSGIVGSYSKHLGLYRTGQSEFTIAAVDLNADDIKILKEQINDELVRDYHDSGRDYSINLTMADGYDEIDSVSDFMEFMAQLETELVMTRQRVKQN